MTGGEGRSTLELSYYEAVLPQIQQQLSVSSAQRIGVQANVAPAMRDRTARHSSACGTSW